MPLVKSVIRRVHQFEDIILILIFALLLSFSLTQIIMRNIFDSGLVWLDGANRVLVLWLALLGASVAGRESRHIRIEILENYLPAHYRPYFTSLANFACSVISGLVAWHSAFFVMDEMAYGDMAFASVPLWVCELIIPITFTLLTIRFFMQAVMEIGVAFQTDTQFVNSNTKTESKEGSE